MDICGRWHSLCKGPEAGWCLICVRRDIEDPGVGTDMIPRDGSMGLDCTKGSGHNGLVTPSPDRPHSLGTREGPQSLSFKVCLENLLQTYKTLNLISCARQD